MPRYAINVNYAPSPWDRVMPAIGQAIDLYTKDQDAQRDEANQIAAQGGVPIGAGPGPSRGQRTVSALGGFIRRRVLGRGDGSSVVDQIANQPMPGPQLTPSNVSPVAASVPASPLSPITQPVRPRRIGEAIITDPSQINQPGPFGNAAPAAPAPPSATPVVRSGPGYQPSPPPAAASPAAGSIGQALQPYTYTSRSGQQYQIDPMRNARLAAASHQMETQADLDAKRAEVTRTQNEQVQALIDAGMSPAVARAKVLNNVVKYDEQFGQPRTGTMTQADRMALQDRIDARTRQQQQFALKLEGLRQQGRTGTREFQQLSAQLRAMAQDDANDRALLSADEASAGRAEHAVTTLQTNPVVAATPAGQEAIKSAQATATAATARADSARARIANKPRTAQRISGGKATITQQQYDAARKMINPATKQPYTDAEIAQFYNIDASVKRSR